MKKLLNDVSQTVPDMLEGLVASSQGLRLCDGTTTVVRDDTEMLTARGTVALISGGGAGHEPAHAGYVGSGLLTAAVSGDVFASPSADAVLDAIREVRSDAGVLLLVKNYTGDVLNFGLAAQIARSEGTAVDMVVIGDDVALLDHHDHDARRGLAGTVLIHKIAGAAAEAGKPLAEVAQIARDAAAGLWTMGVGLGPCTVPASGKPNFELGADEIEWGLGIHGEPGVRKSSLDTADSIVSDLLDQLCEHGELGDSSRVALLVNNLGGTTRMELDVVAGSTLRMLAERGVHVERVWVGNYLTALEMPGVSLSLLTVTDTLLELLDSGASSPAWRAGATPRPHREHASIPTTPDVDAEAVVESVETTAETVTARLIRAACAALIAAEEELTDMDRLVGDGDLGTSLERGSRAVLAGLDSDPAATPAELLAAASAALRRAIGGTSGPLYSSLVLGASVVLRDADTADGTVDGTVIADAFSSGVSSVAELGGATVGDCTMMDALIPAQERFAEQIAAGADPVTALAAAVTAAEEGAASTEDMVAAKGRSRYVADRAIGTPDPGAHAVALWLGAVHRSAADAS